jgi:hypothetical protein
VCKIQIDSLDTLSAEAARKLLEDRIEFKLYAAEQNLKNLKFLDQNGVGINSSFQSRVHSEIEIECLLAQLIGSIEALLFRINGKLAVGLNERSIHTDEKTVNAISDRVITSGRGDLLAELRYALKQKEWLWTLRELRNRGMHRELINIQVTPGIRRSIRLMTDPQTDLEVLPYLELSVNRIRNIVESIVRKETFSD